MARYQRLSLMEREQVGCGERMVSLPMLPPRPRRYSHTQKPHTVRREALCERL